jgi:kinesin family protein 2/24
MLGDQNSSIENPEKLGLFALTAYEIFHILQLESFSHLEVYVSIYEIYCEKLYDLLNERNIFSALEDKNGVFCLHKLSEININNPKDLIREINKGIKLRTVGTTGANSLSSRGHVIIDLKLRENNGNLFTNISFVDLAGTERAVDVIDSNKATKVDTAKINESLFCLKECIRAFKNNSNSYIPFRQNILTCVLRDSFIKDKSKMLMITNISPGLASIDYTMNSLRYTKMVKNDKNCEECKSLLFFY